MMVLKVLGSSSSGNCYILDNGREALIIEAGVGIMDVKKALGFDLLKVMGCLVTHRHNDHAKYIKSMVDCGFHTLALPDVWAAKGINDSRAIAIEPGKGYLFGGFKVLPYPAMHDVPCVGYLIEHEECGKIMFLTDSCQCESRFRNLSHVLIECNYSDLELRRAVSEGRTMRSQLDRLKISHLELGDCEEILSTTDLSRVSNIVLLHMSANNSNEDFFVSEIEKLTGKAVYAAKKGLTIDLTRY